MVYSFAIAFTFIRRNMATTIISVISMSLALLIPAIFMTQYFTARHNLSDYLRMINLQDTYITDVDMNHIEDVDLVLLNEALTAADFTRNVYLYSRFHSNFVMHNHQFIAGTELTQVSPNIKALYGDDFLYQGNWLEHENEMVVGLRTAKRFGIEVNDRIHIGNDEFIVTGIFNIPTKNESIWIYYSDAADRTIFSIRHYIQVLGSDEQQAEHDLGFFFREQGIRASVTQAAVYVRQLEEHVAGGWIASLFLSVIAIIYCVLNIGIIQSLHANEHQKNKAIMNALGASHTFVLRLEFIRSCIVSFVASGFSFLILYLLQRYNVLVIIEMNAGYETFFLLWFLSLLITNIFIIYFHRKVRRTTISEILK